MSKNVIKFLSVMLVLTWTLSAEGVKSGSVDRAGSHLGLHYAENGTTGEADALTGPIVLPRKEYTQSFNRGTDDTLSYDSQVGWGGQFIQSPGDAMLMMYQLPADAILKGVNIPIYQWGTGDQEFTVSVHKLSYPVTADGETAYSSDAVDGNGWIGGYDMAEDGSVSIEGTEYTAGGTVSICQDGANAVAEGARDPLGDVAGFGPPGVPVQGLVWPDGVTAVTMTPATHGDYAVDGITDHWINFADFGSEPELAAGDWVGIMVEYTGEGGGDDEPTGFFYAEGAGVVSPWAFMKFYAGCGGTSGNGGWHIRHWLIRYNLAVELVGDRAPVVSGVTPLFTTMSNDARPVSATITDDNPSGGAAGVANATLHVYPMPSHAYQTFDMTADGDVYSAEIPGMEAGTEVYWWITASDVEGNVTETTQWYYSIFQATQPTLFFYNSSTYGSFIAGYYMYGLSHPFDFWDGANYGAATSDLLAAYESVIEMSGGGPAVINSEAVAPWFAEGGKNYILAGDEWLGAQSGWTNIDYEAGDFQYDVLGIDADYNDINYGASGDQGGVSRLEAVEGDAISGDLHAFLADSLDLNYDPNYELGIDNWLDAVDVVDGFSNAFNAYSTVLDSNGVLSDDAVMSATGPYKAHDNGSKSVFFGFDPLATNTSPGYHWIGISGNGPLQSAVVWADVWATVGDEDTNPLAQSFELLGNYPNPFNPTTNIAFNLNVRSDVTVRIFSVLGEEIATIQSGNLSSGTNMVTWNGLNNLGQSVASGLYIYQVEAGQQSLTGKMMLLK